MRDEAHESTPTSPVEGAAAAAAVLSDGALFRLVAGFQTGYPHAVAVMVQTNARLLPRVRSASSQLYDGVLPRLAVAAGDASTLALLYRLRTRPQYRDDRRVRFANVMLTAVIFKRVEMLETIAELRRRDPTWPWESGLMALALSAGGGDVRVLEWLWRHLPPEMRALEPHDMVAFARKGDLEVVRWLHEHGCEVVAYVANVAASSWNASLVAYLYQHTGARCSPEGVVSAAENGTLETVKLVTVRQLSSTYVRAINAAARRGRLAVVKYFVESGIGVASRNAIDEAAQGGYLSVVQFLHEHLAGGCTPAAMDSAAANGQLDIVRFLHENRTEGCTARALEMAARRQHLEVVEFLCEHRREGDVGSAMISAATSDNLPLVKILSKHLRARDAVYQAVRAAALSRNTEVVKFLCEETQAKGQEEEDSASVSFLAQALRERSDWMVRAVAPFSTAEELKQATDLAIAQEREPQVVQTLERHMRKLSRVGA